MRKTLMMLVALFSLAAAPVGVALATPVARVMVGLAAHLPFMAASLRLILGLVLTSIPGALAGKQRRRR